MGIWFSVTIPLWESDNEPAHYQYADYIARNKSLLEADDPNVERIHERVQPPLYYVLIAASIFWVDRPEWSAPKHHPHSPSIAGLNNFIHTPEEDFPYEGTALAVHVGRLVSVLLSVVAVSFVYRSASLVFSNKSHAIASAALFAFWPQFLFTGSIISNDVLVTCLSSIVLYLALKVSKPQTRLFLLPLLTLTLLAAFLTKANAFGLVPAYSWAIGTWILRSNRSLLVSRLALLTAIVIVSGLTLGYIWSSPYSFLPTVGHTVGTRILDILRGRVEFAMPTADFVLDSVANTSRSFFGAFGWGSVLLPTWEYGVGALIGVVGIAGLAKRLPQREFRHSLKVWLILILHTLGIFATGFGFVLLSRDPNLFPGRYALPALSSLAILLVCGWAAWFPERLRSIGLSTIGIIMLGVSVTIPWTTLWPAYQRPEILAENTVMPTYPLSITFGGVIELLGYDLLPAAVNPGQEVQLVLYFQAFEKIANDYSLRIELVDPAYFGLGQPPLINYPGRGAYPTSLWEPDTIIKDRYSLTVPADYLAPSLARISLSLFDWVTGEFLSTFDESGSRTGGSAYFANLKVRSPTKGTEVLGLQAADYLFDNGLRLSGYSLDIEQMGRVRLQLAWHALTDIDKDYTVFVHLLNDQGQLVAQQDNRPQNGQYPTQFWEKGERVSDQYEVRFTPGRVCEALQVSVGLYETKTHRRIPVVSLESKQEYVNLGEVYPPCVDD